MNVFKDTARSKARQARAASDRRCLLGSFGKCTGDKQCHRPGRNEQVCDTFQPTSGFAVGAVFWERNPTLQIKDLRKCHRPDHRWYMVGLRADYRNGFSSLTRPRGQAAPPCASRVPRCRRGAPPSPTTGVRLRGRGVRRLWTRVAGADAPTLWRVGRARRCAPAGLFRLQIEPLPSGCRPEFRNSSGAEGRRVCASTPGMSCGTHF
jgi:hypothetical protein